MRRRKNEFQSKATDGVGGLRWPAAADEVGLAECVVDAALRRCRTAADLVCDWTLDLAVRNGVVAMQRFEMGDGTSCLGVVCAIGRCTARRNPSLVDVRVSMADKGATRLVDKGG